MKIKMLGYKGIGTSLPTNRKCNCGRLHEGDIRQLNEGTKYDKKAITKLASSGLFDEETSTKIVNALFREDIHAFVHSPSWLEKYLIGIVNMMIKYCDGDRSKAQEFLTNSIEHFEDYLTYIKELRPTLPQEKQLALDKTFNEEMSYEDMLKELKEIKSQRDAESKEKLNNTEFTEDSDFELVPIGSFEEFNSKFGGRATGDGSSDAYAGGGGTAWCHTNSEPTYNQWVRGGKKFFVLAHKDWENIPFNAESNSDNPKDEYGNSLIAILVNKKTGELLRATLRCNHVGVSTNADNQYNTYAELSNVVGFNVEEAVKSILETTNGDTDDEDTLVCGSCGEKIDYEDYDTAPNGDIYCDSCFYDECQICDICGETIWRDDSYCTSWNAYCESCFNEYYFYCDRCDEAYDLDELVVSPEGYNYCQECARDAGLVQCCDCYEWVYEDYATNVDGNIYCDNCFDANCFSCSECGAIYDNSEMNDGPNGPVCDDCFNDLETNECYDDLEHNVRLREFLSKFGM